MAAKCNIITLVLQKLNSLYWGYNCKEDTDAAIVENYLEYLDCKDIILNICNPSDCNGSTPYDFNCNFNVLGISANLIPTETEDVTFDLKITDYVGGLLPFTYQWEYDAEDFDLVGEVTDAKIKLKLKANKVATLLVSLVKVNIKDANGCLDTKQCYLTPYGMECNVNYIPCQNPSNLSVVYNYVSCKKPKALTVINS